MQKIIKNFFQVIITRNIYVHKAKRKEFNIMKKIRLLISTAVLALVLASCSAEENHENTTETNRPETSPTATNTVSGDLGNAAGDLAKGVGDSVKDMGNAAKNAGNKVADSMR